MSVFKNHPAFVNTQEGQNTSEGLESGEYFDVLTSYGEELQSLTENIWENVYLNV